jgi:hypothetical protein
MKGAVTICRVIVGLLFIFSGLIKANDPLGLSYKMQEFFDLWGMFSLNRFTLTFSVLMNAFEIIAGFALLIGWRIRLFSWLLLLLIVFFTFLTGYAYFSGKFKNCGCFGDCIPITPKTSFLKDVVLTILIGFLFWKQRYIQPVFSNKGSIVAILLVTLFSFGIQWYTLNYLPIMDCLPFKKQKNITEQMKMPKDAIPDSTVITFVYEKDGKQVEFTADKFPADFSSNTYKFISRYDKVVRPGKNNEPPIKGFNLSGPTNQDSTQVVLQQPYALLLFFEDFSTPLSAWSDDFEKIYKEAGTKHIPVYAITSNPAEAERNFRNTPFAGMQVFKCDYTAIRTAARTNPCLYLLKQGTIEGKWSYRTMDNILDELKTIPAQQPIVPSSTLPDSSSGPVTDTTTHRP